MPTLQTAQSAALSGAITAAKDVPTLIAGVKAIDPDLAAQLIDKTLRQSKTPWGTLAGTAAGTAIAWAIAHFSLACGPAATAGCWDADTVATVTDIAKLGGAALGTLVGSYIMRYITVSPIGGILSLPTPSAAAAAKS
jgi:hypothetical protein